jgi:LexA-binding, inner membrane-associated putative hydrolase
MFFWFIATAVITIGFVFRDPNFDNRLLIVGSVLPLIDGVLDVVFGGIRPLHSITMSIALLAAVMIGTQRGSGLRKTLLGLPIGLFLHLVFDGAWNDTSTFWWPFTGFTFTGTASDYRGMWSIVLEIAGVAGCVWLWRLNRFGKSQARSQFLSNGRMQAVPDRRP